MGGISDVFFRIDEGAVQIQNQTLVLFHSGTINLFTLKIQSSQKNKAGPVYILGGHKLACSYFEKITQAKAECALGDSPLAFSQAFLIDADSQCLAALDHTSSFIEKSPSQFILDDLFSNFQNPDAVLVPDHTAKHVMLQACLGLVEKKFPTLKIKLSALSSSFQTPFLHKSEANAIWAMSYATWTCPADCTEPKICPHTEGPRDWDFNESLKTLYDSLPSTCIYDFACQPLLAEIAQIPMRVIRQEMSRFIDDVQNHKAKKFLVATHSHCHGIVGSFEIL